MSFLQEYASNFVTDFDFELVSESFVNVHIKKSFVGGNYLVILERKLTKIPKA